MSQRLAGRHQAARRPAVRGAASVCAAGTVRARRAALGGLSGAGLGLYRGVLQRPFKIPRGFLLRTCFARHRIQRSTARALHCTEGPRGCHLSAIKQEYNLVANN